MKRGSFRRVTGKILTYALSAPVVAIAVLGLVAWTDVPANWASLRWVVVAAVFLGLVPLAGYLVPALIWRGAGEGAGAADPHVARAARRQRLISFVTNLVSYPAGAVILYVGRAPLVITAIAASYVGTVVLLAVVNLFYKASGHASGVAGPIVAFFILYGPWALPSLVLLPLVAWARVQVKGHTWPQTVAGALIAAGATLVAFALVLR